MANVTSWLSSGAPIVVTAVGTTPVFMPSPDYPHSQERHFVSAPLYRLFYDRVDYFLGLRDTWEPCPKNIDKALYVSVEGLENGADPLCYMPDSTDPTKRAGG